MAFDPSVSLRLVNNERLRRSLAQAEYRDLGGALALTSDAPVPDLNHIESFATDERHVEALLDVGFALLRAFDRDPAAFVTPLDRPDSLGEHLRRRGLAPGERTVSLVCGHAAAPGRANRDIEVRRAGPDDVTTFANIVAAGAPRWVRSLALASALAGVHDPGSTFYVAYRGAEAAGSMHLLRDGATAGIYAVATLKAHRRRGVCSALLAAAVGAARDAGCDVIGLRTAAQGDARRLFEAAGFSPVHESVLWTAPAAA